MPPSCTPEAFAERRPSTTHALAWLNAPETGACTASAVVGSMVFSSFELASPATATGALVGPSASMYEVVRYPSGAFGPEWHELHCAERSGAMSGSQLTGCASVPSCWRASEQAHAASDTARTPRIACMRILRGSCRRAPR